MRFWNEVMEINSWECEHGIAAILLIVLLRSLLLHCPFSNTFVNRTCGI